MAEVMTPAEIAAGALSAEHARAWKDAFSSFKAARAHLWALAMRVAEAKGHLEGLDCPTEAATLDPVIELLLVLHRSVERQGTDVAQAAGQRVYGIPAMVYGSAVNPITAEAVETVRAQVCEYALDLLTQGSELRALGNDKKAHEVACAALVAERLVNHLDAMPEARP